MLDTYASVADAHDLQRIAYSLATPAIITSSMSQAEMAFELERMQRRSIATDSFLKGDIDLEAFEDILNENGVEVRAVEAIWEDGGQLM